jgi:hypothetical protein
LIDRNRTCKKAKNPHTINIYEGKHRKFDHQSGTTGMENGESNRTESQRLELYGDIS